MMARMKSSIWLMAAGALLLGGIALSHAAQAEFELTGPDGRRILLKDDGTWRYVDATDKVSADPQVKRGELVLSLGRKQERTRSCRFTVHLANDLPYEVQNLLLYYSAYRANGVVYDTVSTGTAFNAVKPGDRQWREFEFIGLGCKEIVRVQVVGGDRCVMGDLDRFSLQADHKGQCLAQVRVAESDLVRFDK